MASTSSSEHLAEAVRTILGKRSRRFPRASGIDRIDTVKLILDDLNKQKLNGDYVNAEKAIADADMDDSEDTDCERSPTPPLPTPPATSRRSTASTSSESSTSQLTRPPPPAPQPQPLMLPPLMPLPPPTPPPPAVRPGASVRIRAVPADQLPRLAELVHGDTRGVGRLVDLFQEGTPEGVTAASKAQVGKEIRAIATKGRMAGVNGPCWCVAEATFTRLGMPSPAPRVVPPTDNDDDDDDDSSSTRPHTSRRSPSAPQNLWTAFPPLESTNFAAQMEHFVERCEGVYGEMPFARQEWGEPQHR